MANPRQRSKARSSKTTARSLSSKRRLHRRQNKAPTMSGPAVLREGWDPKKTVFQNYKALGLLPSLPVASSSRARPAAGHETIELPELPKVQFGRIVRNEAGEIVDIVLPDDEEGGAGGEKTKGVSSWGKALNGEEGEVQPVEGKTDVARALDAISASHPSAHSTSASRRHTSTAERSWLAELVVAHGDDWSAMARDKKRNVWQKTEGEIKRAVGKAGGADRLRATAGGDAMDVEA